jgi:SAM-dependent methyltransferase
VGKNEPSQFSFEGNDKLLKQLYGLLDIPWIYRLSQILLAPGKPWMMKRVFERAFSRSEGRVLDMGCGPKLVTPEPKGLLVGVDINESFVRKYTGGFLDKNPKSVFHPPDSRNRLGFLASVDNLPFENGSFDEVRAVGFLHHLPHEVLVKAIGEMFRCLRKGGKVIVLEDVWPVRGWTRPIAWIIRRLDRGDYMRSQEELLALFQEAWPGHWEQERYTYTFTGSELLYLARSKE